MSATSSDDLFGQRSVVLFEDRISAPLPYNRAVGRGVFGPNLARDVRLEGRPRTRYQILEEASPDPGAPGNDRRHEPEQTSGDHLVFSMRLDPAQELAQARGAPHRGTD